MPSPTAVPGPTATIPAVIPVTTVTIVPTPVATVTPAPGAPNATTGPVIGNVTGHVTAMPTMAGNVTERTVSPVGLAFTIILIIGLLLVAFMVWNTWRQKK